MMCLKVLRQHFLKILRQSESKSENGFKSGIEVFMKSKPVSESESKSENGSKSGIEVLVVLEASLHLNLFPKKVQVLVVLEASLHLNLFQKSSSFGRSGG